MGKRQDMTGVTKIVQVKLEEYSNGYIATSKAIEGLFVSHKSFDKLLARIPVAIRLLMKAEYGSDFVVLEKREEDGETRPVGSVRTFYAKAA